MRAFPKRVILKFLDSLKDGIRLVYMQMCSITADYCRPHISRQSQIFYSHQSTSHTCTRPSCTSLIRIPRQSRNMGILVKNGNNQNSVDHLPIPEHIPQQTDAFCSETIVKPTDPRFGGALNPFMRKPRLLPLFLLGVQKPSYRVCCDYCSSRTSQQHTRMAGAAWR